MILPLTEAFPASAPNTTFLSSVWTARTEPKLTFSPTLPSTRSMRMVSPGATRYCFPPVLITAYIGPPRARDKHLLYGRLVRIVNVRFVVEEHSHIVSL